jgi:TonB family protein
VEFLIHLPKLNENNQLKNFINMHQQKTVPQRIFKLLLSVPVLFVFLLTANAETVINNSPIAADSLRKAKPDLQKPDKDSIAHQNTSPKDIKVYSFVEMMPQFPGGQQALISYITRNLRYPRSVQENKMQGVVIVRFVVDEEGVVDNIEVLRSVSSDLDNEAVRVVGSLPNWIPGKLNGAKVSVYYTLPIRFKIIKTRWV